MRESSQFRISGLFPCLMPFSFCSFIRNRKNESEIVNFLDPIPSEFPLPSAGGGRTMGLELQNGLFRLLHFLLPDVYVPKRREKNQENQRHAQKIWIYQFSGNMFSTILTHKLKNLKQAKFYVVRAKMGIESFSLQYRPQLLKKQIVLSAG